MYIIFIYNRSPFFVLRILTGATTAPMPQIVNPYRQTLDNSLRCFSAFSDRSNYSENQGFSNK